MADEVSIRVNFANPIPLFPLDSVVLLPQQVMPLHIFEPRYRQMVDRALDGVGQIAMAVVKPGHLLEYHGSPPLLPAVCIGQIVQHEPLEDGRYNILLQGVCRARIVEDSPPDGDRLFREARLEPVGLETEDEPDLHMLREWIAEQLDEGPLRELTVAAQVQEYVTNAEVPTPALLELVSFAMLTDAPTRYRLLEEGSLDRRGELIRSGLESLADLIRRALNQHPEEWPKGCSWN